MTDRRDTGPNHQAQKSPQSSSRRRILTALAAGTGAAVLLPEKWVKPIVDKVMVPAHAQATVVEEPVVPSLTRFTFVADGFGNDENLVVSGEFTVDDSNVTQILSITVDYNGETTFNIGDFSSLEGNSFSSLVALRGTIGPTTFFTELEFFDFSLIQTGPDDSSGIAYTNEGPV